MPGVMYPVCRDMFDFSCVQVFGLLGFNCNIRWQV